MSEAMTYDKKPYRKYNAVPDLIRREMVSLYLSGESSIKIAKKFEVSKPCVLSILKKLGCEMRDNWKFKEEEENNIIFDYLSGKSAVVVASKYNTSNVTILSIIKKHNIEIRPSGSGAGEKNCNWKGGKKRKAERMLVYVKKRYAEEPLFRIEHVCRNRIRTFLKTVNLRKKKKTLDILGGDWATVRKYIESQFIDDMSWQNHGRYGWHVDHKIPLASAQTEEELMELFHYSNLQPLWHKENLAKSSYHNGVHHYRRSRSIS